MFRGFCFLFSPLLLPLAGPLGVLLWALSRKKSGRTDAGRLEEDVVLPVEVTLPDQEAQPDMAASGPDDLRRIEGIGPKIADVLGAAGVVSFVQLAGMDVDELRRVVKAGGVHIAYPDTWPEQAALAAAQDWEGLAALQKTLKGGRRV